MNFYTALSAYYDEIFAVTPQDMEFIANLLPPQGHILDVGCGTGNKTVLLKNAASINAIDLDSGMIDYARQHHAQPHIRYSQMDMRNLTAHFGQNAAEETRFTALLCLGNTLVHLSEQEVGGFLQSGKELLQDGGSSVIQILNYDRIIDKNISELPVIETEHTIFTRYYHWVNNEMHFATSITLRASGEKLENDIVLYPLRTKTLEQLLMTAGFRQINWYGSFAGGPLTDDSFVCIAHCLV